MSGFRNFKKYYLELLDTGKHYFPRLVSYNRFIELTPLVIMPLCFYLNSRKGSVTGINFVDSTAIRVCGSKRMSQNKVFKNLAKMSKTTMGWFFGFKLHLIINEIGELLSFKITAGNVDDRAPVENLAKGLWGKLFGDKGYISGKLFDKLLAAGLHLVTPIKKNMKNRLMSVMDKILLRKRSLIETVNDQLKNISQIEHTRHRSVVNCMVNLICGLIAYTWQEKKPRIKLSRIDNKMISGCSLALGLEAPKSLVF